MKIAIFTDSFKPNTDGVATVTAILAKEMINRGHKVTIVCPGNHTEIVKEKGYKVIRIKSHSIILYREHKICFKHPDYLEKLDDFKSYDLFHLQTNITLPALGYSLALKYNKPVSATFHTNIADFATSFFDRDVLANESKSNPMYKVIGNNNLILGGMKLFASKVVWNLTRNFYNAVPSTTFPSRFCRQLLRSKGVKNPLIVLNNPVNSENSRKDYSSKYKLKNKFVLLHVGRLSAEKRVNTLIKIVAKLKKDIPNIYGVICSDGPLNNNLKSLAKKLKADKNILFTGFIPRDELNWLYENCSIVTAFGLFETFNLCATEALFYSKPVIISDSGPHSEIIKDNGYLVTINKEEVNVFAEKITELYNNKKLYNKLAKQSRKLWINYNYKDTIDRHEAFFINSVSQNELSAKDYWNFIKYLSGLSIAINTLLFTLSLKFKNIEKIGEKFESFAKKLSKTAQKLNKK